jgi:hypothetical protein
VQSSNFNELTASVFNYGMAFIDPIVVSPDWNLLERYDTETGFIMEIDKNMTFNPFEETCRQILIEQQQAIGVAYKVLDCGCSLLCGISPGGDPLGSLRRVSGQPERQGMKAPICLKCKIDSGLKRVVWEGIYWPGQESERPDKDFRISIGKKVFGPGYLEPD